MEEEVGSRWEITLDTHVLHFLRFGSPLDEEYPL